MSTPAKDLFRNRSCSVTPSGLPAKRIRPYLVKEINNKLVIVSKPKPKHCSNLQKCMSSRPPLSISQLENPSPCTYSPALLTITSPFNRPPNSSNCERPQFTNSNLWILRTTRQCSPNACSYELPSLFGRRSQWSRNSPSYSMGYKLHVNRQQEGPSPASYNVMKSLKGVLSRSPCYSIYPPTPSRHRHHSSAPPDNTLMISSSLAYNTSTL